MGLKLEVEDISTVEENVRDLYVEQDGKWKLDVEGAVPKARVDEFRNNNIELSKRLQSLEQQLTEFGPMYEKYTTLVKQEEDANARKLIEEGNIDELVGLRAAKMKEAYEQERNALQEERDKYKSQLKSTKISSALAKAAADKGVLPTAVDDVMLRGSTVFELNDDGNVVALQDGNVVFNKQNEPLSIGEWMDELANTAPHLFGTSTGGGSKPTTPTAKQRIVKITRADFATGKYIDGVAAGTHVVVD